MVVVVFVELELKTVEMAAVAVGNSPETTPAVVAVLGGCNGEISLRPPKVVKMETKTKNGGNQK